MTSQPEQEEFTFITKSFDTCGRATAWDNLRGTARFELEADKSAEEL